jgi:serine/threonine-protein kinase
MSERDGAIPERLGRYDIVERLAAGGMGEVFVARFVAPGGFIRPVALKRIHPHLAEDPQFINMLHDEANVASAVKHPNIVATIDVGFEDDNHFVVLDFVSGDPLSRLLREMKRRDLAMPPWVVAWVGAGSGAALHAAHEARNLQGEALEIVHRDVSPHNIMLSDAGHPMLFDFGVAKAKQRIQHTSHGELKGKLAYMAPETFRGAPVDRTVDVFGLGVVLYELLTGVSPFQGSGDLDTITALQSAVVPPPSRLRAIDPRLDAIVLTAMARERERRYPTAAHVERALQEWARAASVSHEAAPVAEWMARTFPERLAARRALLARIADPGRTYRSARPQTPPPGAAVAAVTPPPGQGWGLTPGGGFAPPAPVTDPRLAGTDAHLLAADPRLGGTDPRLGGTDGRLSSTDPRLLGPDPGASRSQVTVGGIARVTSAAPPPAARGRIVAIAVGGVVVGGALAAALALATGGSRPATGGPLAGASAPAASATASAAPAAPAASASAAAATTPAATAPTATTPATASPAPPRPRNAARPPPGDPAKNPGHGPIRRDYE